MSWPWIAAAAVGAELVLGILIGKMIRGPLPPALPPLAPTAELPVVVDDRSENEVAARLRHLIADRSLVTVFQPIVDAATGPTLGYEAFSRFAHLEPNAPPQSWFALARDTGAGTDLELLAASMALEAARALPGDGYVSLNFSPAAVATGRVGAVITDSGWPANRTILEITGDTSPADESRLADSLAPLRRDGVRIAVAFRGSEPFPRLVSRQPHHIKLDRGLVSHADADPVRRALVAAVVGLARELDAVVIAEGIQTTDELTTMQRLGVHAVQGFLIGEPDLAGAWTTRLRRPASRSTRASTAYPPAPDSG